MKLASDQNTHWSPKTNILISPSGELVCQVDLAGIQSGELELTADHGKLRIAGRRRNQEADAAQTILVSEIPIGPFEFVLEIPPGYEITQASSAYVNGLLRVVVPKKNSPPSPPVSPLN